MQDNNPISPTVIPRPEHTLTRANISENALKVLYRLKGAGFQAHLVGGGVRDLLLGREPKDFDVATDATPEEVRSTFRNSRLIGRRFRLAHVRYGREIIEVATFRGTQSEESADDRRLENGMIVRDNVYGSIEEDAIRRDFTGCNEIARFHEIHIMGPQVNEKRAKTDECEKKRLQNNHCARFRPGAAMLGCGIMG